MKIKRYFRRIFCLLAVLALAVGGIVMPSSAEPEDATTRTYQNQINDLDQKANEAKANAEAIAGDIEQARQYKQYLDESISATQDKIVLAEEMIEDLEGKISEKEKEIKDMEKKSAERWERYKERMVVIADDGNVSYLEMLLDAGDLNTFFSNYDAVASIVEYDHTVMNEYKQITADLKQARDELDAQKKEQEWAKEQLKSDKDYLSANSVEVSDDIDFLTAQEQAYMQDYEYYKDQEAAIAAELSAYVKELQERENRVFIGGGWIWPLDGYHTISSEFGPRVLYGVSDYHRGIDIIAPGGTPIRACNGGNVLRSEYHYSWGNYVLIDHGGGQSTLYAHMSSIAVSAGATVSQGDIIGYVGQTGHAYGNHLHLEYWINGDLANPHQIVGY